MESKTAPRPNWRFRARLITAGLIAFDPRCLARALALRTVATLVLLLLLARVLDMPSLVWLGIGAYLLAMGDRMNDGDRDQPFRIAVDLFLGGLALATGILAGTSLVTAVASMMVWETQTGMIVGRFLNLFDVDAGMVRRWTGRPATAPTPADLAAEEAASCR